MGMPNKNILKDKIYEYESKNFPLLKIKNSYLKVEIIKIGQEKVTANLYFYIDNKLEDAIYNISYKIKKLFDTFDFLF